MVEVSLSSILRVSAASTGSAAASIGERVADERALMRQRRLRGVEHAHLDLLVRLGVGDERRPGEIQRRSLAGELVLDHPLPERLADDRGRVARAERLGDVVDVFRRRRRHDPIDHRRWKRDALLDQSASTPPIAEPQT